MNRQKGRTPAGRPGFGGAGNTSDRAAQRAFLNRRDHLTQTSGPCNRQRPKVPRNWRDRLPDPAAYYARALDKLSRPNGSGYAQARCPFHDDGNASLSVSLSGKGLWKCFASCGSGDLVSFHMKRTGLQFADAVRELVGGGA